MTRARALCLAIALGLAALPVRAQDAADTLRATIDDMRNAGASADKAMALTQAIRAYETTLATLRDEIRDTLVQEQRLRTQLEESRAQRGRLIALLVATGRLPAAPAMLSHPAGPADAVRANLLLAELTRTLRAETAALTRDLKEAAALGRWRESMAQTLAEGQRLQQGARADLGQTLAHQPGSQAAEDPAVLRALLESEGTLEGFATMLGATPEGAESAFADAKGTLALPVSGTLLHAYETAPAPHRPGISIATAPRALAVTPWPATIRYLGPLFDYGNVMILEPETGYLMVFAGFDLVYGAIGQVLPAGAPIGLMGGIEPEVEEFLSPMQEDDGSARQETLYIEFRRNGAPTDPGEWFAQTRKMP